MLIRTPKSWEISERHATDEATYLNRRTILKSMGLAGAGLAASSLTPFSSGLVASAFAAPITGFPAARNEAFTLDRPITVEDEATTYTNFYEFGSSKNIWRRARSWSLIPGW